MRQGGESSHLRAPSQIIHGWEALGCPPVCPTGSPDLADRPLIAFNWSDSPWCLQVLVHTWFPLGVTARMIARPSRCSGITYRSSSCLWMLCFWFSPSTIRVKRVTVVAAHLVCYWSPGCCAPFESYLYLFQNIHNNHVCFSVDMKAWCVPGSSAFSKLSV